MATYPKSPLAPDALPPMPPLAGVRIATAQAGIKYKDRTDVVLFAFDEGTAIAGVLTSSKAPSAPVDWCRAHLKQGTVRGLLVNSGNANAFTGKRGLDTVTRSAKAVSSALACAQQHVFLASTGVIGEPLDAAKIDGVMPLLAAHLGQASWHDAAEAIMTTDTFAKAATRSLTIDGATVTIHGIAKGSGMIAPDMATMLAFIATDAPIAASLLQQMLQRSNMQSFNSITVDGDTSTSDTCLLMATGKANMPALVSEADPRATVFEAALCALMLELAICVAKDGEGAQKLITVLVKGAEHNEAARRVGLSIANSPLIKTAVAGEDANWGRVVMAVGKSGEKADRDLLSVSIGGVLIAHKGERVEGFDEAPVAAHMKGRSIIIEADLGIGTGAWTVYSCDLTHGYIAINADYRS